jgi:hypothetical protein
MRPVVGPGGLCSFPRLTHMQRVRRYFIFASHSVLTATDRPGQPYPYSGELTPASSGHGSQVVSPRSDSSSSFKLPWPMPPPPSRKMSSPAVRGPPSPELISQDCAFPPFPIMPKSRSNTPNSDSDGETLRKPAYPKSNLSSPRGSVHTTGSNSSKSRSRRDSTASSKSTAKGRNRAKTIEMKPETSAVPSAALNMRRRPSLSNLFGMRKNPTEKVPPMPAMIPNLPTSRKGSKDDQAPLHPVQSAPAGPSATPMVTPQPQNMLQDLQQFDFQVSAPPKSTLDDGPLQAEDLQGGASDRASVASSIYPDPPQPSIATLPAAFINEDASSLPRERRATLTRLDGPGEASSKEPSYKSKRPAPIDSNLTIGSGGTNITSPKRSPTYPLHNTDRQTGNGPNGIMGRRPSDSSIALLAQTSEFPLSPIRTGTYPPNSIGNLRSPKPVVTPISAVPSTPASYQTAPTTQPTTGGLAVNMNRASIDSASSYGSDASVAHSTSSQSSPPRDEERREVLHVAHENPAINPFSTDLPQPLRPRLPRMQTDSPTDPLFQNGLLSPIPASPSVMMDPSPGLASDGFDFRQAPAISPNASPGPQQDAFKFRPRQMSNAGDDRPKQLTSRHVPKRSHTMGANKGTCRGCQNTIASYQKSVSSADGRLTGKYHKECFACHTCKSPFATADFYVLQDLPYCAHHYHELNGTLCVGCGKGIEGQYLESNNNKISTSSKFHAHCLACATCRCPLRDDYFEFNGKVYCERDAFRAASPHTSRSQYDTAPSRPSPLSQGMVRADSEAGAKKFPERRTTKLMSMENGNLNIL